MDKGGSQDGVGVGVVYSITTFIRDVRTLLQIRQVAHLIAANDTCESMGWVRRVEPRRVWDAFTFPMAPDKGLGNVRQLNEVISGQ